MAIKEKRKHARVKPRGVIAQVRAPRGAFACQVENLSAGGLFLRTDQQLSSGTPLQLELVKVGGRKGLHVSGVVAGAITPGHAAAAKFIPGIGVKFVEIADEEAERLEALLTALGVAPVQAAVAQELRRNKPPERPWGSDAIPDLSGGLGADGRFAADPPSAPIRKEPRAPSLGGDAEAILRDIHEALEAEEAPLATSRPALPPQPAGPPTAAHSRAAQTETARLMAQIRGLLLELGQAQERLRAREAEVADLRAQLDDARARIEELERGAGRRR